VRRFLAGTGKLLITLGILILLFVAYQLWGTGLYTARAQHQLEKDFERALDGTHGTGGDGDSPVASPTTPVTTPAPPEGEAVAHIVIPKIDADDYVVEGVDEADLRKGPGHYPSTPLPGQQGNAAIAGHRTTYGAPFGGLDELEPGDQIGITTLQGTFRYKIYDKLFVSPDAFEVLDPDPARAATLTLTSCHPKYSAAQRIVVKADLALPSGAAPLPSSVNPRDPAVRKAAKSGEGLSGNSGPRRPAVLMGIVALLVGALWWLLFHRHPRWTTWILGAIPFAVVLFIFYFFLERALPANY
jgi:sortase A